MAPPGETEAGSTGMHRAGAILVGLIERMRDDADPLGLGVQKRASDGRPAFLKNRRPAGEESLVTEKHRFSISGVANTRRGPCSRGNRTGRRRWRPSMHTSGDLERAEQTRTGR
jgi:hypothetical protein